MSSQITKKEVELASFATQQFIKDCYVSCIVSNERFFFLLENEHKDNDDGDDEEISIILHCFYKDGTIKFTHVFSDTYLFTNMKVYNDHILLFTTFRNPHVFTFEIETKELKEVIDPELLGGMYLIDAVMDNEGNILVVGSTIETIQKAVIRTFNSNGSIISNSSHIGSFSYRMEGGEESSSRLTKIKVNENNDYVASGFSQFDGRKIPIVSFKVGSVENIITLNDKYVIDFIIIGQYFYVFTGGLDETTFTVNKYGLNSKHECLLSVTFTADVFEFDDHGVLLTNDQLFKGNDDSLIFVSNTNHCSLPHAFKFSYDLKLIDDAVVCEPLKLTRTLNP